MATINYQVLTENDDKQLVNTAGTFAYDGAAGEDHLEINWPFDPGYLTFSLKQKNGVWVEFAGEGMGNQTVTLNAISHALAAANGEFQYAVKGALEGEIQVNYKNFEKVSVTGTTDNDVFIYQNGEYYDGNAGIDTFYADLSHQNFEVRWDSGTGNFAKIGQHDSTESTIEGMERLLLRLSSGNDYINNMEFNTDNEIHGGAGNDMIGTGGGNDLLRGGTGHDVLLSNGGKDKLYGEEGNDVLLWESNSTTDIAELYGGVGNDLYMLTSRVQAQAQVKENANEGNDTVVSLLTYDLRSNPNVENALLLDRESLLNGDYGVFGLTLQMISQMTDQSYDAPLELMQTAELHGNNLNNELIGNWGNNVLKGYAGNDTIYGNMGNDTLDGGTGADVMYGGVGDDKFYVDNVGDKVIEYVNEGRDTVFSTINYDLSKTEHIHIENAVLLGTGNLTLQGSGEGNLLKGNAGNNQLNGLGGNDWLEGGAGNDVLNGNAGADRMIGGAGNDVYYADSKSDVVVETAGGGRDTVNVSFDYDLLKVAHIENAIAIGAGHIKLQGSGEGNLLKGNAGNNQLNGLGGNDWLEGGAGHDVLVGGSGRDVLVGGTGNDTFKFGGVNDSTLTLKDVINDFTRGQDKIDLSVIDANTTQTGNQAFSFIGNTNFTSAGQVRFTGGVVSGDVNGDKVADFAIEVKNVTTLQASDFIL